MQVTLPVISAGNSFLETLRNRWYNAKQDNAIEKRFRWHDANHHYEGTVCTARRKAIYNLTHSSTFASFMTTLYVDFCFWVCGKACEILGEHQIEDAGSYAGPDSAYESYVCLRCGEEWSHTYY
jgi:hypothetical protein